MYTKLPSASRFVASNSKGPSTKSSSFREYAAKLELPLGIYLGLAELCVGNAECPSVTLGARNGCLWGSVLLKLQRIDRSSLISRADSAIS